jgi:4-cresol dehydrogenase (hydroxylating)
MSYRTPQKSWPNIEAARDAAAGRLAVEIGAENVIIGTGPLDQYYDPFPIGPATEFEPGLAIRPGSVEEVQAVLRVANEVDLPLWTVSQGRNNAYGGGSPRLPGAAVLDLRRMNRILDIDEVNGTALLEPGVRFFDLHAALVEGGYAWWCSVPDLGWGSVVGNAMDRGFGYTPYGVHNDMSCGLEVVLPGGQVVRTGMGSMAGSKTWQIYKPGFGPAMDGVFAQSNYGVVTKMGTWLMPRPEEWVAYDISVPRFDDLEVYIDTMRPLKLDGSIQSNVIVGDVLGHASFMAPRAEFYTNPEPIPDDVIDEIAKKLGLGRWNGHFGIYDRSEMLDVRMRVVEDAFGKIPGVDIKATRYRGDAKPDEVAPWHQTRAGIAGMNAVSLPDWWGGRGGHLGLAPVSPLKGGDALRQAAITRKRFEEYGFDLITSFTAGARHMCHVAELTFDRDNAEQVARAREVFALLVDDFARDGYGEYRTHIAFMDLVASVYDFNDNALLRLQEQFKDAVDPNGILSPGKSGVWPARLRDQ